MIVELDDIPNAAFNVHWAGWDNTSPAPSSAVAIHHPSGDEKRISFDEDPLTITGYGSSTVDSSATHLRVGQWEDGTTEPGSSGSGIWNAAHRLVGTLSGGSASCEAPTAPDWYGRMATHWEGGGTAATQLKVWLDPGNTGAETLDGRNACDAPTVSIVTSPANAEIGQQVAFSATATGGSGSYTYAWDFNNDGVVDSTEINPLYTYNYFYQGNVKVTATDSSNCPGIDTTTIVISNTGDEIFPPNAEIPTDWSVPSTADAGWALESSSAYEGTYSLKSLNIADNQTASIEVTQNFTNSNNFVSFAYKLSTESGYDKLKFFVDDVEMSSWSGIANWVTVYFELSEGTHTLRWSYIKDESVSEGDDTVWIDGVTGITYPTLNEAPTALVASTTINMTEGENASLDASASTDPENDALTFLWEQISGDSVTLSSAATAVASFTAPSINANTVYTFRVTVTDSSNNSDTETVTVNIADSENNDAPVAGIANSIITADEETTVNLDATSSSDANGDSLTFSWSQTAGASVSLTNATSAVASFVAPSINGNTTLTFMVTVTDPSGASDTEEVAVNVVDLNVAPTAVVALSSITVDEGETVTLDASSSTDSDGDELIFSWTQTAGTNVSLTNSGTNTASFTAPNVSTNTTLTFNVAVTDPSGATDSATVSVTINDTTPPASSGGGGSFGIVLIGGLLFLKKRKK